MSTQTLRNVFRGNARNYFSILISTRYRKYMLEVGLLVSASMATFGHNEKAFYMQNHNSSCYKNMSCSRNILWIGHKKRHYKVTPLPLADLIHRMTPAYCIRQHILILHHHKFWLILDKCTGTVTGRML